MNKPRSGCEGSNVGGGENSGQIAFFISTIVIAKHFRTRSPKLIIFAQPNSSDMGCCMLMDPNFVSSVCDCLKGQLVSI